MNKVELKEKIKELENKEIVSRNDLQSLCLEFQNINDHVALLFAPRVGKTKAALNIIRNKEKVLIVSNTILIRSKWESDIKAEYTIDFKSICYQSLHKEMNEYDVIILDEADLITDNYFNFLKEFTPKRFIILTGTATWKSSLLIKKLCKENLFEWSISTQQAINWKLLPQPEIILFGLNLQDDKSQRNQVFQIGKDKTKSNKVVKWGEHYQYLRGRKENLLIQCTEKEWLEMIEYDINRWKQMQKDIEKLDQLKINNFKTTEEISEMLELSLKLSKFQVPQMIISNNIKRLGLERKKFFALRKNRFIKKVIKHFNLEKERVLIFANSIPQAEWISEETAVHSGKDSAHLLEAFNKGEISKLVTVNMLDRGIGTIGVNTSIIIQMGGSEASNKQKSSRNMLDVSPKLIIMYYMNTQDQIYVDRFITQFKPEYIKRITPYG